MSTPSLKRIVTAIQKLYPTSLADKTWDNTGLLLDCPFPTSSTSSSSPTKILLTIDLTSSVADEAIEQKASLILAYHPFIFRPLKSISLTNSQQNSLIRLTQSGISVYCPHTAIDAAIGGVNDWLADGISGGLKFESSRNILESVPGIENIKGHENGGMGRIINLKEPVDFDVLLNRVKTLLGMKNSTCFFPYSLCYLPIIITNYFLLIYSPGSHLQKTLNRNTNFNNSNMCRIRRFVI